MKYLGLFMGLPLAILADWQVEDLSFSPLSYLVWKIIMVFGYCIFSFSLGLFVGESKWCKYNHE